MKDLKIILVLITIIIFVGSIIPNPASSGSLEPSNTPTSTMYTLGDIYNKLTDSEFYAEEGGAPFETPEEVVATHHNLSDIYNLIPVIDPTKVLSGTNYLGVDGTFVADGVLKTGQEFCLQGFCEGTNLDGDLQRGKSRGYQINGDGTITDIATNLMWQLCPAGVILDFNGTCLGGMPEQYLTSLEGYDMNDDGSITLEESAYTYPAIEYCENLELGGFTDWHLPNINELLSLRDYGLPQGIDIQFDYYNDPYTYISSTIDINQGDGTSPAYVWVIQYANGNIFSTTNGNVRCVRG